ncbi:hypothetical protein JG688_00016249 [Phytophthora aleatoria]|uniref:Uncharacterized protein n=1 Tax=Phytophthora aleatoria TaxID=2496075 RepID=A0A8J5IJ41_9STRA|nr:hypothetical protein JG688_00016249 [Phytophthora aleatoria]
MISPATNSAMDLASLLNAADNYTGDWELDADDELDQDVLAPPRAAPVDDDDEEEEVTKATAATSTQGTTRPAPGRTGNPYVDGIVLESGLHINHEANVQRAYSERQEVGLFSLFFVGLTE